MPVGLSVVKDDDGIVWIDSKTLVASFREVEEALNKFTTGQQLDAFGSIGEWFKVLVDDLESSLNGTPEEDDDVVVE